MGRKVLGAMRYKKNAILSHFSIINAKYNGFNFFSDYATKYNNTVKIGAKQELQFNNSVIFNNSFPPAQGGAVGTPVPPVEGGDRQSRGGEILPFPLRAQTFPPCPLRGSGVV